MKREAAFKRLKNSKGRCGLKLSAILAFLITAISVASAQVSKSVDWYVTTPDKSSLFLKQEPLLPASSVDNTLPVISPDDKEVYQTMDGFGFALTGGSAININRMKPAVRQELLDELFGSSGNSIGSSYLRISIGASDLSDRVFSYDDLSRGKIDPEMKEFSIDAERKDLIPVLKQILKINPGIRILGSPWSPPVWMKTNGKSKGGSLKPEFYDAYALYFVKYIQSMKAEDIPVDAITVQNEPLHPGNNPSMYMTAGEQAAFIRQSLGPAFRKAGITTKIIIYDHNPNRVDYPIEVLKDSAARVYIDGTAFHMYEGKIDAISEVHNAFPDKNLFFTEQWVGAPENFADELNWHVKTLIIGASRNWCKNVIEWNLAADRSQDPHTKGGCFNCLGAITIDGNRVIRNPAYYIIAHASRFVVPGSVRIGSNTSESLPNVAFRRPDGKMVLIVINDTEAKAAFYIRYRDVYVKATLSKKAVATLVW
jgi:glucosylceramidase